MTTVHDVAAYIMERLGPMSAMKLQKLIYYAQAWALALAGRPLFEEQIQAWANGPVVYELFDRHRGMYVVDSWQGDTCMLSTLDRALIDRVLQKYAPMSADALSRLTHAEQPWREARGRLPDFSRSSAVISQESMRRFYAAQGEGALASH